MVDKITINDLLGDSSKEPNTIHQLIKEDLAKITTKTIKKNSFYDLVPTTELEKNISEVLKNSNIEQKRREKSALFEFDRKMNRINKIKSKTYRRMRRKEKSKLKELQSLDQNEESEEEIESGEIESEEEESEEIKEIKSESEESDLENKNDFTEEKNLEIEKCQEKEKEVILPGWGSWGGEGLEIVKNKFNTIKEVREEIKREDLNLKNVIINPNKPKLDEKYLSTLPPSLSKQSFYKRMNVSVSKECNSLRVFDMFAKSKDKKNEVTEEFCFEPLEE